MIDFCLSDDVKVLSPWGLVLAGRGQLMLASGVR